MLISEVFFFLIIRGGRRQGRGGWVGSNPPPLKDKKNCGTTIVSTQVVFSKDESILCLKFFRS